MTATRIYTVKENATGAIRLVEAANASQATRFVSSKMFEVKVASAVKVAEMMANGSTVEQVKPKE